MKNLNSLFPVSQPCAGPTVCVQSPSRVQLFATPWTVARQAPPSMGFPRQGYGSGLPFPPPGDLPDLGIKVSLAYPALQVDSLPLAPSGKPPLRLKSLGILLGTD